MFFGFGEVASGEDERLVKIKRPEDKRKRAYHHPDDRMIHYQYGETVRAYRSSAPRACRGLGGLPRLPHAFLVYALMLARGVEGLVAKRSKLPHRFSALRRAPRPPRPRHPAHPDPHPGVLPTISCVQAGTRWLRTAGS